MSDQSEYQRIVEYLREAERSKYTYHDIKTRFEQEAAATYGDGMGRWIPDFEYAHKLLLDSIALYLPALASVEACRSRASP